MEWKAEDASGNSTTDNSQVITVKPLDSDGDGVPDDSDQCPGTPTGTPVDANGCPLPPPLPTSKDECKKGGWEDFDVFKNQGDCVSFTNGKK